MSGRPSDPQPGRMTTKHFQIPEYMLCCLPLIVKQQAPEPPVNEVLPSHSLRAAERAAGQAARAKRIERREACFDLFVSGYTHRQIADAMKVSVATVRRVVDGAIDE